MVLSSVPKKKVLVLCHDTIGSKMAGPGIRYQNIADQVKKIADVSLAVFSDSKTETSQNGLQIVKTNDDSYQKIFDKYDVIFAQWLSGDMLRYAKISGKVVIIDLYAPVPVEYLASKGFSDKKLGAEEDREFMGVLETYRQYLTLGDFFVCSNQRQLDFWAGYITASGLLTPSNFKQSSKLERLALCPMGISSTPPSSKHLRLRKQAGLKKDDFVLLWTGGIWDWFDAQVVIKAVDELANPKIKLVFMGTQHPNSKITEMSESKAARDIAKHLGLINKSVFFLDGWVDYNDRDSYLLDADAAIYADKDSIETRFSHRTRVLDHIWVGLPTICSRGDYLSEVLETKKMGIVVNERTPKAFAEAINRVYSQPSLLKNIKANIEREAWAFTWEESTKALLGFIKNAKPTAHIQPPSGSNKPNRILLRRVKNSVKVLMGRLDV